MSTADTRTLKLANVDLTDDAIDQFLRYQRALVAFTLEHPQDPGTAAWEGRMAFAHADALKASGLNQQLLGRIEAACSDFCGKRWAMRTLLLRRQVATERLAKVDSGREREVIEKIDKERKRLEDMAPFRERYGDDTLARLLAREAELLELHQAVSRILGAGHLHR